MADKKELYEILCEGINSKMDLVLEGYSDMGRRFEEARIERQETKADLKEAKECLTDAIQEVRTELTDKIHETRTELEETRAELEQKIDKIGEIIEDHEIRIESLENNAGVG